MKYQRYLHVSKIGYENEYVPYIRLKGKWLEKSGFSIGEPIKVDVGKGKLTVVNESHDDYRLEDIVAHAEMKHSSQYKRNYEGYLVSLRLVRNKKYEPVRLSNAKEVFRFLYPLHSESDHGWTCVPYLQ